MRHSRMCPELTRPSADLESMVEKSGIDVGSNSLVKLNKLVPRLRMLSHRVCILMYLCMTRDSGQHGDEPLDHLISAAIAEFAQISRGINHGLKDYGLGGREFT